MKEIIEVSAKFLPNGQLQPLQFAWQGRIYRIESIGRQWQDDEGRHTLVMVPGEQVCELLYAEPEKRWYLLKSPNPPGWQVV